MSTSSQDTVSVPIGGHPATVTSTEQAIAVSRDEAVDEVAQWGRHDPENSSKIPGKPDLIVDAEDSIAVPAYPIALHDEQAYRIIGIHAVSSVEGLADLALHRCKTKLSLAISLQNELGVGRAQQTFAIEQNDGTGESRR